MSALLKLKSDMSHLIKLYCIVNFLKYNNKNVKYSSKNTY